MRRIHEILVPLVAACIVAAPVSAQDTFEGVIAYDVQMAGMTVKLTQMTKGTKVRQEMDMSGPMGQMISLTDVTDMVTTTLIPAQKMYMTMDLNALAQQMQQDPRTKQPEPSDFKPTGETETIAGHSCSHYTHTQENTTVDVCVAGGLGFVPFSTPGTRGGSSMGDLAEMAKWRAHFADGFIPLEVNMTGQGQEMTMRATSVEKKSLADDLFQIPAGYTEMKMPGGG